MAKTTILVDLLVGPGVPSDPSYIRFTPPHRFVSGSAVYLAAGIPLRLVDGKGSIDVEPGVWVVDELALNSWHQSVKLVPESATPIRYTDLVDVESPAQSPDYGPSWSTAAQFAAAVAQESALAAGLSAEAAARSANDAATAVSEGIARIQEIIDAANVIPDASMTVVLEDDDSAFSVALATRLAEGMPSGIATLDEEGQLPESQVPDRLAANLIPKKATFDVRDYGAIGDGVTDDLAAINAAIAAWRDAVAAGGEKRPALLLFPSGYRFAVSAPVLVAPTTGNMTGGAIMGHGAELIGLTPLDYVLRIDSTGTNAYWRHWAFGGLTIRNGGVVVRSSANLTDNMYAWSMTDVSIVSTGLGHGIFVDNAFEGKIDTPKVSHAGGTEFSAIAITGNASSMEIISGVTRRGKYGVYADGTDVDVFGITTLNADLEGIRIMNARGNVLSGVHVERCQQSRASLTGHQPAIYAEGAITVSGAYIFETSTVADQRMTHAVSVYATSTGTPFIVGIASQNVAKQVRSNGAAGTSVVVFGALTFDHVTDTVALTRVGASAATGMQIQGSFFGVKRANGTDLVFSAADTSTTARLSINALGALSWAGFGTAPDTVLSRPSANLLAMAAGDGFRLDGTWDGGRLLLGANHLWVDATGKLRIKNGAPTSDLDGTPVGP